jgi:geranylgeranyl reductase family protein
MLRPHNFDVAIIGAGPAGATLAHDLAGSGIRVIVLEKNKFPRYKCCGGGITTKTAGLLDPELSSFFEDSISCINITYAGDTGLQKDYERPLLYTVMRDRFDQALITRAEKAGAAVFTDSMVNNIVSGGEYVDVATNRENIRVKFLVGADGIDSFVARTAVIKGNRNRLLGIETEVRVSDNDMVKWRSRVLIEIGRITAGYAWVFPKADHLSIGIGCLSLNAKYLKKQYYEFLNSLNLENPEIKHWGSAFIPVCTGQPVVHKGRVALIGDAAGLADPLTGEGIHNAIISARLAAIALKNSIDGGNTDFKEYAGFVENLIVPEMKLANTFAKIFTLFPHRIFKLMQQDERVWLGCCQLLLGDRSYLDVKNRLNSLGGIYNFLFRHR